MSENPDIQWALDILTPEPDYKPSLFVEYGLVTVTPIALFFGACMKNRLYSRPAFAGIQTHIYAPILGFIGAYMLKDYTDNYYARRDQMLRDYVIRHPEDFPPPERKKWSEIFEPWLPIR